MLLTTDLATNINCKWISVLHGTLTTRATLLIAVPSIVLFPLRSTMTTQYTRQSVTDSFEGAVLQLTHSLPHTKQFSVARVAYAELHAKLDMQIYSFISLVT